MTTSENHNQPNPMKEELVELTKNRLQQIFDQRTKIKEELATNPNIPDKQRANDLLLIEARVVSLRDVLSKVIPYIKNIRQKFTFITDQNKYVACYLLLGKVVKGFEAIFELAKGGFSYDIMVLIRSNREAMDLAQLFLVSKNTNDLAKWFKGQPIKNHAARIAVDEFINNSDVLSKAVPHKEIAAGIYHSLSMYDHISLTALIDAIDIFHDDFDFEGYAGAHYTAHEALPYLRGEVAAFIITLKHYYSEEKDHKSYKELSALLVEAGHKPATPEEINRVLNKYRKPE